MALNNEIYRITCKISIDRMRMFNPDTREIPIIFSELSEKDFRTIRYLNTGIPITSELKPTKEDGAFDYAAMCCVGTDTAFNVLLKEILHEDGSIHNPMTVQVTMYLSAIVNGYRKIDILACYAPDGKNFVLVPRTDENDEEKKTGKSIRSGFMRDVKALVLDCPEEEPWLRLHLSGLDKYRVATLENIFADCKLMDVKGLINDAPLVFSRNNECAVITVWMAREGKERLGIKTGKVYEHLNLGLSWKSSQLRPVVTKFDHPSLYPKGKLIVNNARCRWMDSDESLFNVNFRISLERCTNYWSVKDQLKKLDSRVRDFIVIDGARYSDPNDIPKVIHHIDIRLNELSEKTAKEDFEFLFGMRRACGPLTNPRFDNYDMNLEIEFDDNGMWSEWHATRAKPRSIYISSAPLLRDDPLSKALEALKKYAENDIIKPVQWPKKEETKMQETKFGVPKIKKVLFENPAVIVFWDDGTKTVVHAQNEPYDPEKGLAMAVTRKALGNGREYYNYIQRFLKKAPAPESKTDVVPKKKPTTKKKK